MKRYLIFMVIILGMIAPTVSAQTVKQKVAVYVTGDTDNSYKKVIGSKLVTAITRSEEYAAVERTADFLAELTKEHDYQLSGAVTDKQIARLGEHFGVRYVLVADLSEIFSSMFISARMIDVQTAQITSSTETNGSVNNFDDLSNLSESIVLGIIPTISSDLIKQINVATFDDLYNCTAPDGYHIATADEIEIIRNNYQITGKNMVYPIYTDVHGELENLTQVYIMCKREYDEKKYRGREIYRNTKKREYKRYVVACNFIENADISSKVIIDYFDDKGFADAKKEEMNYTEGHYTYDIYALGLEDMRTPKPIITSGFVFFVKN